MATTDLGKVVIVHKGTYLDNTLYEILDVVEKDGSSYICILDTELNTLLTNRTYWLFLCKSTYQFWLDEGNTGSIADFLASLEGEGGGGGEIIDVSNLVTRIGTNRIIVVSTGTAAENATELQTAYDLAKTLTPYGTALSATNRVTIEVHPGNYSFGSNAFVVDTQFIDIVSATGNADVYIHSLEMDLGLMVAVGIKVTANDVFLKGITTKTFSFILGDDLSDLKLENCVGGTKSFNSPSGTFSGTATDCIAGSFSFGSSHGFSGTATNCVGGMVSFGGDSVITATAKLYNCRLTSGSFRSPEAGGLLINCINSSGATVNYGNANLSGTNTGDQSLASLLNDRGAYNASSNTFPSTGGSGTDGAILKGNTWNISVAGTLGSIPVLATYTIRALADTPGQTAGNWLIQRNDSISDIVTGLKTKVLSSTPVALTISDNAIAWDASQGQLYTLDLATDAILNNPTNIVVNAIYQIEVNQSTFGKVLTWGSYYKFPNNAVPVISLDANAIDIITIYVKSATQLLVTYVQNFS